MPVPRRDPVPPPPAHRTAWSFGGLATELRDAVRATTRSARLSLSAIACIAVGITATGSVLMLYSSVFLRPLPFPDAGRLLRIWNEEPGVERRGALAYPDVQDLRASLNTVDRLAGVSRARLMFLGGSGARRVQGEGVTPEYFDMLGIQPERGRLFGADDYAPGAQPTMLLSHASWITYFGANPDILGSTVQTTTRTYTVVGILPPTFMGTIENDLRDHEFWVPIEQELSPAELTARTGAGIWTLGRRRPGVSTNELAAEVALVSARLARADPAARRTLRFRVEPMGESWRDLLRAQNLRLLGVAGLLLLVAAVNVAGLLVARTLVRGRELALRAALGATRGRLVRQIALETVILSGIGGAIGLLAAAPALTLFLRVSPDLLPAYVTVEPDGTALFLSVLVVVATAIVAGVAPAVRGARVAPSLALSGGGTRSATPGWAARRQGRLLVVGEVALTTLMLFTAGLLLRSFAAMGQVDLGYRTEHVLRMAIATDVRDVPDERTLPLFYDRLRATLLEYPGVERVGLAAPALPPGYARRTTHLRVPGLETRYESGLPVALHEVDHGFFPTLDVRVVAGRNFTDGDRAGGQPVAIVSESIAAMMGGARQAVGREVREGGASLVIVGVVADLLFQGPVRRRDADFDLYVPLPQHPVRTTSMAIATRGDPADFIGPLRQRLGALAPSSALHWISTMRGDIADDLRDPLFDLLLVAAFAVSALGITAVGLFAVLANQIVRRTAEFGIRQALGAARSRILRAVLLEGLALGAAGLALGGAAALGVHRLLRTQLYGVGAWDQATMVTTALVVLGVAAAASYVPARRAAGVDPLKALGAE